MTLRIGCLIVAGACLLGSPALAQTYQPGWAALASDRTSSAVGDSLTVIIVEMSSATSSTQSGSRRDTRLSGSMSATGQTGQAGALGLEGSFDGRGQTNRSGRLIGQIGVTVQEVLPNGDLRVAGAQTLEIDGERMDIQLTGRVRLADISADNTVLSSRMADAHIVYDGEGTLSRSGEPGLLTRIMSWFGL